LGIEREDKFKKYKKWADADRIFEDALKFVMQSLYPPEKILETLKLFFILLMYRTKNGHNKLIRDLEPSGFSGVKG
jgi:hypothetical protein